MGYRIGLFKPYQGNWGKIGMLQQPGAFDLWITALHTALDGLHDCLTRRRSIKKSWAELGFPTGREEETREEYLVLQYLVL